MTYDEFSIYITYVLDYEIPPVLLEGLNLGVIASPRLERSKKEPQFIVKGHYIRNRLGKQIVLYYGSFIYLYSRETKASWESKILATIKHELTHHIEALAGQENLAKKEQHEAFLREQGKR